MSTRKDGIGLAANQVGINAQVAVVNVREPIMLINPVILSKSKRIHFYEGCLSFPKVGCHTDRWETVTVETAQEEGSLTFSGVEMFEEWENNTKDSKQERHQRVLEAVCVQHEIDHLYGCTIYDRRRDTTVRVEKKIGRNNLVTIKKDDAVKVLKYKKVKNLLNNGWVLQ